MTCPYIVERQEWIQKYLHTFSHLKQWRDSTANMFCCSISTVLSDIYRFRVYELYGITKLYPTPMEKFILKKRDHSTCQYCGTVNPKDGVCEHVICCLKGGKTESYNMVYACKSCNIKKGDSIWIPRNIEQLALENKSWADKILLVGIHKIFVDLKLPLYRNSD